MDIEKMVKAGSQKEIMPEALIPKTIDVKETSKALTLPGKQEGGSIGVQMSNFLKDSLMEEDYSGQPFYKRFIKAYLKEAEEDPAGYCGRSVGSGLFNEHMIEKLSKSQEAAYKENIDFQIYMLRSTLYKEQQEVFDDIYDRTIMVICSRRAGKTELNARLALKRLLKGEPALYLNKTFANAINQLFGVVEKLIEERHLNIVNKSKADGVIELSNGGVLRFAGMNDISSLDKLRGGKYGLVLIDECGHIKNGDYLMDEVVVPMTSDFEGSQVVLTGTPPRVKNYATKLWHNKRIRHFHWVADVNPFIPDFQEHIDRVCLEKGFVKLDNNGNEIRDSKLISENNPEGFIPDYSIPFIQREYYGNMDAFDTDALVVPKYKTWKVDTSKICSLGINKFIIGVDFGFVDFNAIVTLGFNDIERKVYVFKQYAFGKAGDDEIKNEIKKAYYDLLEYNIPITIVTDTNQPGLASDLALKEHLPVEKAYKYDLSTSIYETSGLLRTRVFIPDDPVDDTDLDSNRRGKGNILKYEFERTVWERDEATDVLTDKIDDTVFHPNAFHALRYALRNGIQHWSTIDVPSNMEDASTYNVMNILQSYSPNYIPESTVEEFTV